MPRSTPARHRAPGLPRTAVDDAVHVALAVTAGCLTTSARRTAVALAASGLVVSSVSGAAAAPTDLPGAPGPIDADRSGMPEVDVPSLTTAARAALRTSPAVVVPVDATWTFDVPQLTVVADPPPPPPPVLEEPAPTSRSAAREPAPAAEPRAAAPAPAKAVAAPPASVDGNAVLEIAATLVGTPYVYGGTTTAGFDCSGFTSYVYAQLGITLPRTSSDQHYAGTIVSRDEAQPGDLVWSPGHIGIYAGGNMMIDSPKPGTTVEFREMYQSAPVFIRIG